MSKKRIFITLIVIIFLCGFNIFVINYAVPEKEYNLKLNFTIKMDKVAELQLFYISGNRTIEDGFNPGVVENEEYENAGEYQKISFDLPGDVKYIRLDFGEEECKVYLKDMYLSTFGKELNFDNDVINSAFIKNGVTTYNTNLDNELLIECTNTDPNMVWSEDAWSIDAFNAQAHGTIVKIFKVLVCLLADLIVLFLLIKWEKSVVIPRELINNRKLIFQLAKNDFKTKFAGSYLGIIWAFIQPIVTVVVYWFVFEKGLKAGAASTSTGIEVPFVIWLVAGLVPWFFLQDALSGGTNALTDYTYLVKKVVFKISILPIVKVISALFVHLFFIAFTIVLLCAYGYWPNLYTLQIVYYSFCVFVYVLGLSYLTSALVGFFKDLTQIINIILQIGVWVTPIMWNIDTMEMSQGLKNLFKINPMYYIVAGYRDSLINKIWFWENPTLTVYFWIVTIVFFALGMTVFKKLRVHFADVL